MVRARPLTSWLAMAALCMQSACTQSFDGKAASAALDERFFECKVQPVLTKSCAMLLCHGDSGRYLRIFASNRLRYGGSEADRAKPIRPEELRMNYLAARAMVDVGDPEHSFLLEKPLEQTAGGYYHRGATLFGMGNVFADRKDADYKVLADWINGKTWQEEPACVARFAAMADAGASATKDGP